MPSIPIAEEIGIGLTNPIRKTNDGGRAAPTPLTINGVTFFSASNLGIAELKVVVTGDQAYQEGLTTYTNRGVPLRSEGMVRIEACRANGSNAVLSEPVTVKVPVPANSTVLPNLYEFDARGNWVLREQDTLKVIEENGQRFYSITIINCGWLNLDVPKESLLVEIQPSKNLAITKIHLAGNDPNYNYNLTSNFKSKEAVVMPETVQVDSRAVVYCALLEEGEIKTYRFPLTSLNGSRDIKTYPTINKKRVSWLTSLFKKTENQSYTHYTLSLKDLEQFEPIKVEKYQ